jgi:hypothetical protein
MGISRNSIAYSSVALVTLLTTLPAFGQNSLATTSASPALGNVEVKPGDYSKQQASYQAYDTTGNVALSKTAIASSTIAGYPTIHAIEYINDGFYGNGSSWISASENSWIMIDLGKTFRIDALSFGRDRLNHFDDRDPGRFSIDVATEADSYSTVFNSSMFSNYSGYIIGNETWKASFGDTAARYVKVSFQAGGVAVDEIQIFAVTPVPEPETYAMFMAGLGLLGFMAKRKKSV